MITLILVSFVLSGSTLSAGSGSFLRQDADLRSEESQDYFDKWLKEDVLYIITSEERAVFEQLSTSDEKEQFIEQFWFRRDPNPSTAANEFKEEHYRRIAYANDNFQSGWPGWRTDRGRIYILHGPPTEIEFHPAGERYDRPMHEGGGTTSTHAYITWRYRSLDGVGHDIVLEFVDDSFSGEYRLAISAQEKDALLHIAEQGLTLTQQLGGSNDDQAYLDGDDGLTYGMVPDKETAFGRYALYTDVLRPTELKYRDLEKYVSVDVNYDSLPVVLSPSYFRIDDRRSLIPITVKIENKDLTFTTENGRHVAGVALFGTISNLSNRIVQEFEHDLGTSFSSEEFQQGLLGSSIYQKVLLLDGTSRYKLNLVVKDLNSSKVGVVQQALIPRAGDSGKLSLSSSILSNAVRKSQDLTSGEEMFLVGDVWIVPSLDRRFKTGSRITLYFQLYGARLDQATLSPSVEVEYAISSTGGEEMVHVNDPSGGSVYKFSSERIILMREFSLDNLPLGKYRLSFTVKDQVGGESISAEETLEIVD